ncbi:MAG: PRC-barrel domain-containing protein [Candidatus Krumholzibacteriia bacterium]
MLRSLKEIKGYVLDATDGDFARCEDFLLDDQSWTVRYMVADTGKWLPGRRVLVSPIALGEPDQERRRLPVRLSKEQIGDAPELDEHAPVTRQYEIWYHKHYGWPYYWGGTGAWAMGAHPGLLAAPQQELGEEGPDLERPHIHSVAEVIGYAVGATDEEFGRIEDFIVDDETWSVRHAVVATSRWLGGKSLLLPMSALEDVAWDDQTVRVGLSREMIEGYPEYDPGAPVNRELEERVYDYLGRPAD